MTVAFYAKKSLLPGLANGRGKNYRAERGLARAIGLQYSLPSPACALFPIAGPINRLTTCGLLQSVYVTRDQFFSETEMNIRIPFCNVWHLNGILRNLSEKDALTEQKNSKYLGNDCYF